MEWPHKALLLSIAVLLAGSAGYFFSYHGHHTSLMRVMSIPTHYNVTEEAKKHATLGSQIILAQILRHIKTPDDLLFSDKSYFWSDQIADVEISLDTGVEPLLRWEREQFLGMRVPVVAFGFFPNCTRQPSGHVTMADLVRKLNFTAVRGPFVMWSAGNENWGFLSTPILNRTGAWRSWQELFGGGVLEELLHFLDDPRVVAYFVNQHHLLSHPKILSLPLGISYAQHHTLFNVISAPTLPRKTVLLMFLGSGWGMRQYLVDKLRLRFGHDLQRPVTNRSNFGAVFYPTLITAKFVLCPPGIGYDTYRLWEVLSVGSVPVLERNTGLDRSLSHLPVLLVDDFMQVTPQLLNDAYERIMHHVLLGSYDFSHLTRRHWAAMMRCGSTDIILRHHPPQAYFPHEAADQYLPAGQARAPVLFSPYIT